MFICSFKNNINSVQLPVRFSLIMPQPCDELAIMYRGRFVEYGDRQDIYLNPQHIYTKRFLSAIPNFDPGNRELHKRLRREIESEYKQSMESYLAKDGRVGDLIPLSKTHRIAGNHRKESVKDVEQNSETLLLYHSATVGVQFIGVCAGTMDARRSSDWADRPGDGPGQR